MTPIAELNDAITQTNKEVTRYTAVGNTKAVADLTAKIAAYTVEITRRS